MAAWSPWTWEDLETLEKVQKRAGKAVSGLGSQSYKDRLVELKLPSLRERRKEIDGHRQPSKKEELSRVQNKLVIDEWNNLPNSVKEAATAEIFKRLYRHH